MTDHVIADNTTRRDGVVGPCRPLPLCGWQIRTNVPAGSKSYEWNLVAHLENHADEGENVAFYAKHYKHGRGPGWGACIELQDYAGKGPLWGLEVDLFSVGTDPASTRRGIGVVYGTVAGGQRASHDVAVHVLPNGFDPESAKLRAGFRVDGDVLNALEMPGGAAVSMSDDPAVPKLRFDPQTGFVGLWKGRLAVWAVHAVTGEVVQMREFP